MGRHFHDYVTQNYHVHLLEASPLQALMKLGTVVGAHVARADGTSEPESGHPPTARKKPRHSEGDRDRGRQRERESERETVRET